MEARIAMGDCIISDLERLGDEWGGGDRRNWTLLTENIVREKYNKMQFDPSLVTVQLLF